jgi:hypothetical protein
MMSSVGLYKIRTLFSLATTAHLVAPHAVNEIFTQALRKRRNVLNWKSSTALTERLRGGIYRELARVLQHAGYGAHP